ncbi:hypothetical protein Q31b_54590 [Novipirellula aureliae]|uniref:Uncharacterized protein n=1 Tax=Novipirellula aureliae TaxID=2527966 RepID=A0A5C6DDP0_9BACT|nr:hypothetical protein Q31b_54590 [Novipirellula aureliae]
MRLLPFLKRLPNPTNRFYLVHIMRCAIVLTIAQWDNPHNRRAIVMRRAVVLTIARYHQRANLDYRSLDGLAMAKAL